MKKSRKSAVDEKTVDGGLLLNCISPVLIILMVISIVWFLVELFYRGPHTMRLRWVLGLFSAASVLVSRISIEGGRERSWVFAIPLAAATFVVSLALVEGGLLFPPLMAMFVVGVLWLTDRLTWDCTVIDSSRDASASGLIQQIRLSRSDGTDDEEECSGAGRTAGNEEIKNRPSLRNPVWAFLGFGKGKNTPGLWTLCFLPAALMVFAIGQAFIPPDPEWGYLWLSFLFAIFVAASLSLLATTSYLGLLRYLIRRRIRKPAGLQTRWLTAALTVAAIAAILTLLIPKPTVDSRLHDALAWVSSRVRTPSQLAVGNDGTQQGPNAKGSSEAANGQESAENRNSHRQNTPASKEGRTAGNQSDGGASPKSGQSSTASGNGNSSGGKSSDGDSSNSNSSTNQGTKSIGEGKNSQTEKSGSSESEKSKIPAGEKGSQESAVKNPGPNTPQNRPAADASQQKPIGSRNAQGDSSQQKSQRGEQSGQNRGQQGTDSAQNQNQPSSPPPSSTPATNSLGSLAWLTRLITITIGLVTLVVAIFLFRQELAGLWREIMAWISGKPGQKPGGRPEINFGEIQETRQLRFRELDNPFRKQFPRTPKEIIQQTITGMETLAAEHGVSRESGSTPSEFAQHIGSQLPILRESAAALADITNRAAYSGGSISESDMRALREIWKDMESADREPVG